MLKDPGSAADTKRASWIELLEEYAALNLTYESDRLPAIAGLASRAAEASKPHMLLAYGKRIYLLVSCGVLLVRILRKIVGIDCDNEGGTISASPQSKVIKVKGMIARVKFDTQHHIIIDSTVENTDYVGDQFWLDATDGSELRACGEIFLFIILANTRGLSELTEYCTLEGLILRRTKRDMATLRGNRYQRIGHYLYYRRSNSERQRHELLT
jgi:hypothetical protein